MGNKIKHLEMIQSVISRMAGNSFLLKGWAVTLVAGIFALSSRDADKMYFLITYVPVLIFWCFDAYYLRQERLYRALYNAVRAKDEADIDFDMDTIRSAPHAQNASFWNCLSSPTELCFYLPLAMITTVIILITSHI